MINNVVLMGRLTADPELRTSQSGVSYIRFSVAVERPYSKGKDKTTDFINCVAWRQTAEFIDKYFVKGQMIALVGSLRTDSYTNKDGAKVNTVDVNVDNVSFTGGARAGAGDSHTDYKDAAGQSLRPSQSKRGKSGVDIDAAADMAADDLPF